MGQKKSHTVCKNKSALGYYLYICVCIYVTLDHKTSHKVSFLYIYYIYTYFLHNLKAE